MSINEMGYNIDEYDPHVTSRLGGRLSKIAARPSSAVTMFIGDTRVEGLVKSIDHSPDMREQIIEVVVTDKALHQSTKKKESQMDTSSHHKVTVIHSRKTKSAHIYVETSPGVFLSSGGTLTERKPGDEMPRSGTMPDEIFVPLLKAGRDEYGT